MRRAFNIIIDTARQDLSDLMQFLQHDQQIHSQGELFVSVEKSQKSPFIR